MKNMKKDNTGVENSGNWNSGDWNSGNRNSGDWNSGDWNSGNCNSGYCNSGYNNSGYRNSGNWNSGYRNSGNWNSGYRNSGDWNSGDLNSGYLNVDEPKVRIFGKETDMPRQDIVFPQFMYFDINFWINSDEMSEEEKKEFPEYKTTGGYLKNMDYKDAFKKSWEDLSQEEKERQYKQLTELPNWNPDIFYEISGIDFRNGYNEPDDDTQEAIKLLEENGYKIIKK